MSNEIFDHKYVYEEIGYNLKPIELQASMGLEQIKKLQQITELRKRNFSKLSEIFIPYEEYFILPKATSHSDPNWFAFPLTIKDGSPFKRSDFCSHLEDNKIQTRPYFGGNLMLQPAYQNLDTYTSEEFYKAMFPSATKITTDTFFLGTSPVITLEQLEYIKVAVDKFFTSLK
jgi:CDP-6-deoxy-D-xylo-4-hexulose-3-dehydrase